MTLERRRALGAGLARRNSQVDQLACTEETEVRVGSGECVPAEVLFDDEHLALVAPCAPRRGTDRIAGLDDAERLVAVHDIERQELSCKVRTEIRRAKLDAAAHAGFFAACSLRTICCTASVCISFRSRCSCVSRASTSLSLNEYVRRSEISPGGSHSLPSRSCKRNCTRLISRYSRTLPAPDNVSTSLSSATSGMSRMTSASLGSVTSVALPVADSARRNSAASVGAPAGFTKIVWNVYVASPRRWKPQPASTSADATPTTTCRRWRLKDDIDEPSRYDDHFPDGGCVAIARDFRRTPCRVLDRRSIGRRRYGQLAARLAVHLEHELDFVLRERLFIECRPRRIQEIAMLRGEAEIVPQHPRHVRNDRIQHPQQHRRAFANERGSARRLKRYRLERVQHFHAGRDDRVVLHSLVVVIGLLQRQVQFAPGRDYCGVGVAPVEAVRRSMDRIAASLRKIPQPPQESVCAFDAGVRPFDRVLGRAREHDEKARGVGAVSVDHVLRIDAVELGFRHRAEPVVLDRESVGFRASADNRTLLVADDVDVGGSDVVDATFVVAAIGSMRKDSALSQKERG